MFYNAIKKMFYSVALSAMPFLAFAQQAASGGQDGNQVITQVITFLGSVGYLILAIMVVFGLYCMWVFGSSLQKMGDDSNRQDEVKPKTLVLSLLGAIVCTYGTYTLGVGMRTVFNDNAQQNTTFSLPSNNGQTGGGS